MAAEPAVHVVTGATAGIGRSIAEQLAATGDTVAMVGRDQARIDAARDEITRARPTRHGRGAPCRPEQHGRGPPTGRRAFGRASADRDGRERGGGVLVPAGRDRRRPGAHVRHESSRSVPAHQPAPALAAGKRRGAGRSPSRPHPRPRSTSTISRAAAGSDPSVHSAPARPPTCCSPSRWPAGWRAAA